MELGFILVHGYTGSSSDFGPLKKILQADHGYDSVTDIMLPKHGTDAAPPFEINNYILSISSAVEYHLQNKRMPAFIGHSTGGIFILSYLAQNSVTPGMLILASVPKRIDTSYLERWERHNSGAPAVTLIDIAKMVSAINTSGSQQYRWTIPLMILSGARDELVPPDEAYAWQNDAFGCRGRILIDPSAGHHIFKGEGSPIAVNGVRQFITDACETKTFDTDNDLERIVCIEPKLGDFLKSSPLSARHILKCPAGVEITGAPQNLSPIAVNPPVFANIEPTTLCNLRCRFCAREFQQSPNNHMTRDMFRNIVSLLPHVFRINLVGLGEPLMNPHIVDFVSDATHLGKNVGIVTNAMLLGKSISRELLTAGLKSITFSIDAPNQSLADELRFGTDFSTMVDNIRTFMEYAIDNPSITASVFCALSLQNIGHFDKIIDLAAELNLRAIMATDINFEQNLPESLLKNNNSTCRNTLRAAISRSFTLGIPVLSIRGLEQFALEARYYRYLLRPSEIFNRKPRHDNCRSPWQCAPVNSAGNIALCDCQPDKIIGNILHTPLDEIWNSNMMIEHRKRMTGNNPPSACRTCPRF